MFRWPKMTFLCTEDEMKPLNLLIDLKTVDKFTLFRRQFKDPSIKVPNMMPNWSLRIQVFGL